MLKTHASHSQPINIINNFIFMLSVSFFSFFGGGGTGMHHAACGIFSDQGLNLCPLHWKPEVLTTGPSGKFIFSFMHYILFASKLELSILFWIPFHVKT